MAIAFVIGRELPLTSDGGVVIQTVRAIPTLQLQRIVCRATDSPHFMKGPLALRTIFIRDVDHQILASVVRAPRRVDSPLRRVARSL